MGSTLNGASFRVFLSDRRSTTAHGLNIVAAVLLVIPRADESMLPFGGILADGPSRGFAMQLVISGNPLMRSSFVFHACALYYQACCMHVHDTRGVTFSGSPCL